MLTDRHSVPLTCHASIKDKEESPESWDIWYRQTMKKLDDIQHKTIRRELVAGCDRREIARRHQLTDQHIRQIMS